MATSEVEGGARQLLDEASQVVATVAPVPPPYKDQEHLYNGLGLVPGLDFRLSLEERFDVTIGDRRFVKMHDRDLLTDLIRDSRTGVPPL